MVSVSNSKCVKNQCVTSSLNRSLFLLVFLRITGGCLGASLSVSGSSSYAVLNQPFTLTCIVLQAANLNDKILFIMRTSADAFASLKQNMTSCSVFNAAPSGYTVSCGSGTGSSSSSTKTYSLRINRAAAHDATDWWCQLSTAKTRSDTFSLQFSRGPDSVTFSPPPPGSVVEGDSLTVACSATGCNPPCSYSWNLRNQQMSPTSQLKLTNITRSQTESVYTCNATNSFLSKSETKRFTLTVNYGPDSVQLNTTSPLKVKEGDDVAVSCEVTNCSPSCSFTWKFNSDIKPSSSVLSLNNIQRSAAGNYSCTARNTKTLDKTITLDVQYRSLITSLTLNSQSTNVTVDELTAVTLRCDVDSNPGSDIKLLNKSQILRKMTNSKQAEYTWNKAGCLDTGHYRCEAGNNIKSDVNKSLQLVVRCSPRVDHRVPFKKEFAAAEGGNVTLKISVIANPIPTFTWYNLTNENKKELGSGGSATTDVSAVGTITLTHVRQEDIGTYQVVVSNGAPRQDLVVNLTLHLAGPPNIPMNVTAWSNGPHSVSVSWIEEFNGGSDQTFLIQYRADTTSQWTNLTKQFPEKGLHTNHTAVISNLQPETRYLVRVLAYNKYGYKGVTKEQEALTSVAGGESSDAGLIGGVVGGLTGGVVIIVIVIVLVLLFIRRRNQNSKQSEKPIIDVEDEKHIDGNDNLAFDKDKKTKKPRKKALPASRQQTPQLNYTTVEFSSGKPSTVIHQAEEPTIYIEVDFTKNAPAMDPDTGSAK